MTTLKFKARKIIGRFFSLLSLECSWKPNLHQRNSLISLHSSLKNCFTQYLETYSIGISSDLHCSELQPCPASVQLCGANKGDMDAQRSMHSRTVYTQEYSICHAGPSRVVAIAVKACLEKIMISYIFNFLLPKFLFFLWD